MRNKLFILSIISFSVFADCKLDQPINIGRLDLLDKGVVLKDAQFDKTPVFIEPELYDAKKDKIDMPLFNIEYSNSKTGYLGASIEVVGKLNSIGFSKGYHGNFHVTSTRQDKDGVTTYTTKDVSEWVHQNLKANFELQVKVENGQIISVEMTLPIYTVKLKDKNSILLAFEGKHQTLCLKSAH